MSYTTNNGTSWTPTTNSNAIGFTKHASGTFSTTGLFLVARPAISTCGTYVVTMNVQFTNSPNAWIYICGSSNDKINITMPWQSSGGNPTDPGAPYNEVIACKSARAGVAGSSYNLSCSATVYIEEISNGWISFYTYNQTSSPFYFTYSITKIT
tara:strand:- start:28 stop:489 length:462 start_codon:yes stop_codon:yes gene_type:complete